MSAKTKINPIHFWAVATIILYLFFSKVVLVYFSPLSLWLAFLGPFVYGVISGLVFLYLFSHEDFFPLAWQIEKEEEKNEKKWIKSFAHHGKLFICLAVGAIAGPLFGAITVRLLIHRRKFWYKYALIFFSTILSTILLVGIARGIINIF
jgi:hypothetical protein